MNLSLYQIVDYIVYPINQLIFFLSVCCGLWSSLLFNTKCKAMKKICLKKYYLGLWTHQKVHKKKKDVKKNQKIRS